MGAQLVKQAANSTNDIAGDGTTTATLLTNAIARESFKAIQKGRSPIEIKRGVDKAVDAVIEQLQKASKPVETSDEIKQVATISANGDVEIGQLISDAMKKVGNTGTITAADGKTMTTELEVVEGMSLKNGWLSPYFVTNPKTQKVEFTERTDVVLCNKKISSPQQLIPVLNLLMRRGGSRPILIVAEDVDGEALTTLILNKLQGRIKVAVVKAPGFGDSKKGMMQDLAVFTGATVFDDDVSVKLEDPQAEHIGSADNVTIDKDTTVLMDGGGTADQVKERVAFIHSQIAATDSDWERDNLQQRVAKLAGGVAVIKVGGASEVEVGEKKDRVVDALNATRAAVAEGIVPGGGVALLNATRGLGALVDTMANEDQRIGVRLVERALKLPTTTIAENAGEDGSVICHKILEQASGSFGFNASNGTYVDMVEAGIIDPLKVVKTALLDASSVASLMMTMECAITDTVEDDDAKKQ
eukprot:NODE_723_length_1683_cov_67.071979_g713_i0.p1 GENE.NODE_723_length_1683_cov_67.071979_g713_i0~~NODE_723_length_1683_cov_67.071979_g713_i0.p1  ORF type:complete len:539 (+),score=192.70 NODE_723_length_1683_cov_67.071979_g713_i0:203-1618(+)